LTEAGYLDGTRSTHGAAPRAALLGVAVHARRPVIVAAILAVCLAVVASCLSAAATASVAPLPESDYTTHQLCGVPAPGDATCLATELVPLTAAARARTHPLGMTSGHVTAASPDSGAYGLSPDDLRSAYFPGERPDAPVGEPQTIALVDAYDDRDAEADLGVYSEEFGLPLLPRCAEGAISDCFEKVNQSGETGNLPVAHNQTQIEEASDWAGEISIDIEVAHGICRNCRILLVEASSAGGLALEEAVKTAERLGATEVSNSWTGGERNESAVSPFDDPRVVITAGAGDNGYLNWAEGNQDEAGVNFPASSPYVIAAGGTRLTLTAAGTRASETVWNEGARKDVGGGGCSSWFPASSWQTAVPDWQSVGCGVGEQAKRAVADIAADSDPATGVAIYDSAPYYLGPGFEVTPGWQTIGGTSVASPIIASMFALVGGAQNVEYPAATLYSHLGGASLYDVTAGGNGKCDDNYKNGCEGSLSSLTDCGAAVLICNAGPGYDGPTGVGAPAGLAALEAGLESGHAGRVALREVAAKKAEEEQQAAERKATEERRAVERKAAEERQAEEERLAPQRKAEEEQRAAERLAAEQQAEAERKAKEQVAREQQAAEEQKAQEAARAAQKKDEEELQAAERAKAAEDERQAKQAEEALRKALEAEGLLGKAKGGHSRTATVRLDQLVLTARASAAVAEGASTLAQVAFTFDLSAAAQVRVTLSRGLPTHGRTRWVAVAHTLAPSARGHDQGRLSGSAELRAGSYRLTLAPAHGAARSIVFAVSATTSRHTTG
jgi:hypothetical protein